MQLLIPSLSVITHWSQVGSHSSPSDTPGSLNPTCFMALSVCLTPPHLAHSTPRASWLCLSHSSTPGSLNPTCFIALSVSLLHTWLTQSHNVHTFPHNFHTFSTQFSHFSTQFPYLAHSIPQFLHFFNTISTFPQLFTQSHNFHTFHIFHTFPHLAHSIPQFPHLAHSIPCASSLCLSHFSTYLHTIVNALHI